MRLTVSLFIKDMKPHLKDSFFCRPKRIPFGRIEKLVGVNVVQKLPIYSYPNSVGKETPFKTLHELLFFRGRWLIA